MLPHTPILSRDQIRAYDAHAIEHCQVPGVILMENAGRGAAELIAEQVRGGPVVIVAGRGNNGGDGFVIARHLAARGIGVEVYLLSSPDAVAGDAKVNLDAWVGLGGPLVELGDEMEPLREALADAEMAVDAIFGTGLSRDVEGRFAAAIHVLNNAPCPVVAIDIPSGVDGETGAIHGVAVDAAFTITFAHLKCGLLQGAGLDRLGDIFVVRLGIPDDDVLRAIGFSARVIDEAEISDLLGRRPVDTHKYKAGSLLVIGGAPGKTGAAMLTAGGALRSGAGLVTIASWPEAVGVLAASDMHEVMTAALDPDDLEASLAAALDRRRAVAIGPGLGLDDRATAVVDRIALGWEGPAVLDADAISALAGRAAELKKAPGPRVLTPHAGELARLMGTTSADVEAHRFEAARAAADATGATIVLKGYRTVLATGSRLDVNMIGEPVLATAGSGDVLTGIIGARLAADPDPHGAAIAGVYLHALAAKSWVDANRGDRGMIAREISEALPPAIATLTGG